MEKPPAGKDIEANLGPIQPENIELLLERIKATIESARSESQESKPEAKRSKVKGSDVEITQSDIEEFPSGVDDIEPGSLCIAHHLYEKQNKHGQIIWVTEIPEDQVESAVNKKSGIYALVVKHGKRYDGHKKLRLLSIKLQSELIRDFLSPVLDGYPGINCEDDLIEFCPPFTPFIHRCSVLSSLCRVARSLHPSKRGRSRSEMILKILISDGQTSGIAHEYVKPNEALEITEDAEEWSDDESAIASEDTDDISSLSCNEGDEDDY